VPLCSLGDNMVADVTAKNLDGGVDRQRRELAELLHVGVALLATAEAILIRRVQRNIRVARRHDGSPQWFPEYK
jgi:hypothetical protein